MDEKLEPRNLSCIFESWNDITLSDIQGICQTTVKLSRPEDFENFKTLLTKMIGPSLVKDFPDKEDRDFDSSDFPDVGNSAVKCFQTLKLLLPKLRVASSQKKSLNPSLVLLLKLCATHHQVFAWSDEEASDLHLEILQEVLQFAEVSYVQELLCSENHPYNLFKSILSSMRPTLTKENWTKNASSCQLFKWFLTNVKFPYLADYLVDVLPPSLMFIDHHATRNKVLGIHCLTHIIDNVPPSELKLFGRADVVYDALFHLTYSKEPEIVNVLFPAILKLLSGQERNLHKSGELRLWQRYDDVYHKLLWYMEMENIIVLRRAYSAHVPCFVDALGITIAKHLKRHMRVLLAYLSVYDGDKEISRINVLKALRRTIEVAQPRMDNHCENIFKSLMFLVSDVIRNDSPRDEKAKKLLLEESRNCFLSLRCACPNNFKNLSHELLSIEEDLPGLKFLRDLCENMNVDEIIK